MGLPGGWEWVIIALVALLIFGGTAGARLAGLGKGAGRAIREFKEETQSVGKDKTPAESGGETGQTPSVQPDSDTSPDKPNT